VAIAYVYLMRCRDGSLYCGWSTDPRARAAAHNAGRGAAYTRSRRPVRLVYCEALASRSLALRREWAIKRLDRRAKLALVRLGRTATRLLLVGLSAPEPAPTVTAPLAARA
jgi:putative endonuclease